MATKSLTKVCFTVSEDAIIIHYYKTVSKLNSRPISLGNAEFKSCLHALSM